MKLELIKDEIASLLENLSEQFETINQYPKNIPQIELDIVMRNIQKLYETTIQLNKANSVPMVQAKVERNGVIDGSKIIEVVREEVPVKAMAEQVKPVAEIVEKEVVQPAIEEVEVIEAIANVQPVITVENNPVAIAEAPVAPTENKILSGIMTREPQLEFVSLLDEVVEKSKVEPDLFNSAKASKEITDLNNKLAEARNTHSIVEKLQSKRIENLKSVIGINDKFYFINELFAGDARKYEDVIYTLNNFKKFDDAMQYFSTLKYRFNWDELSAPYEKLVKMLERKFDLANA